jgi:hypothetical protein
MKDESREMKAESRTKKAERLDTDKVIVPITLDKHH